ncbi:TPA: phosphate uptake regulator PhoU [Candidatus Woesearchaeota archaeon]|nr:phosphate uptake regulator PhoU [Candidatus Woesearchaeota archaeon]
MEYRKIIEFGKSSYVISLPKDWLAQKNLKKGDVLYLDKEHDRLYLYPPEKHSKPTIKSTLIDITGLDSVQIKFLLVSRYINNHNEITIVGKDLASNAPKVRDIIHDLIALEIIEETSEKILTRDFLNMNEIDILEMLKKMDSITREMMRDSLKSFDQSNSADIKLRDKDVNRICYLVSRTIRYLQRRPALAKEKGFTQGELLRLWNLTLRVESIADNTKRVASMMQRVKMSDADKKEFLKLFEQVHGFYSESIQAYFNREQNKAVMLRPKADVLTKKSKDYFRSNWDVDWVPTILEKVKGIVADTKQITAYLCDQS